DGSASAACTTPTTYAGLAVGDHSFKVEAKDSANKLSAATEYKWKIQAPPPPLAPSITSQPANPTNQTSATFAFTDSSASATFLCSLDGSAFAGCASPKSYVGPQAAG